MERKPTYEELEQRILVLENEVNKNKQLEEEKKNLEIQLIQAQKMESLGTLASGIAHDFNNILTPIIGYTEMMLRKAPSEGLSRKNLLAILEATNRAKDLVKQILTFGRQTKPEKNRLLLQPIIKEALKLLRSSIPSTISIRQDIEDGFGQVNANPTQIHQMIMNLGINAYHAMRGNGGVLKITLRQKKISTEDRSNYPTLAIGSYMELVIGDTGQGIDNRLVKRIFDPYFTTKKLGEGTGLGLSLVHSIVKDHNGHITVESEAGKGTTFHIFLPSIVATASRSEVKPNETLPGGCEHILLVDDEPLLLQMVKQMLEGLGYKVTIQSNSIDALKLLGNHPEQFDIVITDMTMPYMTGDKLAQRLLEIKPDIPVVLCSGFSETITENEILPRNIRAFLTKPLTMAQIASTIRGILDRERIPCLENTYTLSV